jgi:hypothetical protein
VRGTCGTWTMWWAGGKWQNLFSYGIKIKCNNFTNWVKPDPNYRECLLHPQLKIGYSLQSPMLFYFSGQLDSESICERKA